MNYLVPELEGQIAFLRGERRDSNPVDSRTNANACTLWDAGWVKQRKITCKGIEIEPNVFSGCTQSAGDCPVCGK